MSGSPCQQVRTQLLDLIEPSGQVLEPDASVHAHLDGCQGCTRVLERMRIAVSGLSDWVDPAPPPNLVASTASRVVSAQVKDALAGLREPPESDEQPAAVAHQPFSLLARVASQALAASCMFLICSAFGAYFYPALTEALESRRMVQCQQKMQSLLQHLSDWRETHPESSSQSPHELLDDMLRSASLSGEDLTCPAASGTGGRSYEIRVSQSDDGERLVICDRFGNHEEGVNVLIATTGDTTETQVLLVDVDALATLLNNLR